MELFDSYAEDYAATVERSVGFSGRDLSFFHHRKVELLRDVAQRRLGALAGAAVLDVGCGAGVTAELLRPHVASVHGVDVSAAMVEQARRRTAGCAFDVYDGSTLPFVDERFDLVTAICVLHHVPPSAWQSTVAELVRVTRPGGVVAVIEHNRLNPLTRRAVRACPFDEDAVLLPQRVARQLLDRAGAGPAEIRHFLFTPIGGPFGYGIDRLLRPVPFGGQYAAIGVPRA